MHFHSLLLTPTPTGFRAEAQIESAKGPNGTLWFEVENAALPTRTMAATAFLAGCLPAAVWLEEDLTTEETCDRELLLRARRIAHAYGRLHQRSRYIAVQAPTEDAPAKPGRIVASSYSGGVDSLYSLLTHQDPEGLEPVGAIVIGLGFDCGVDDKERHNLSREWAAGVTEALGLRTFAIRTNFRGLFTPYAGWGEVTHIACLAAFAFLISEEVHTYLVPSAACVDQLFVHGSHALIDGAYASGPTGLVSDGWETHRDEKTAALAAWPLALQNLKVCGSQKIRTRNCGRCEKCIRTMIGLRLAGVKEFPTFPHPFDAELVRQMRLFSPRHFFRYRLMRRDALRDPELRWLADAIRVAMVRGRYRSLRLGLGRIKKSPKRPTSGATSGSQS